MGLFLWDYELEFEFLKKKVRKKGFGDAAIVNKYTIWRQSYFDWIANFLSWLKSDTKVNVNHFICMIWY